MFISNEITLIVSSFTLYNSTLYNSYYLLIVLDIEIILNEMTYFKKFCFTLHNRITTIVPFYIFKQILIKDVKLGFTLLEMPFKNKLK